MQRGEMTMVGLQTDLGQIKVSRSGLSSWAELLTQNEQRVVKLIAFRH
jgi:hypothetical protein